MKISAEHIAAHQPFPQWRFLQLTIAIVAWTLISPLLHTKWSGHVAMQLMLLDVIVVTMWANPQWVRARRAVFVLWCLSLVASVSSVIGVTERWARIEQTLDAAVLLPVSLACIVGVLAFAFRSARPTVDGIFATIVAYLLIAMVFAELYFLVLTWTPGALHLAVPPELRTARELRGDLMYFSLVTLATVGYGDILPVSPIARALATFEAVTGQFYVAVVVAMFVTKYTAQALAARSNAGPPPHDPGEG